MSANPYPPGNQVWMTTGTAVDYETLAVDNTAGGVSLTATKVAKAGNMGGFAILVLETAEIRFTTDGTAPTTTVGIPLEPYQSITIQGKDDLTRFRAIRTTSTSGSLKVQYFQGI